jgi:putative tricarboxylic transport membrane protein
MHSALTVTSANPSKPRPEIAIALFFIILSVVLFWEAWGLPFQAGYAGVGPGMVPTTVAAGLALVGACLLYQALTGGFRGMEHEGAGVSPNVKAVLWILAGLVAFMVGAKPLGFVPAATALFACAAQGFGSAKWKTDVLWGFGVSMGAFLFFNKVLGVDLPAGVFKFFM